MPRINLVDFRLCLFTDEDVKCYQGQKLKESRHFLLSACEVQTLRWKPFPDLQKKKTLKNLQYRMVIDLDSARMHCRCGKIYSPNFRKNQTLEWCPRRNERAKAYVLPFPFVSVICITFRFLTSLSSRKAISSLHLLSKKPVHTYRMSQWLQPLPHASQTGYSTKSQSSIQTKQLTECRKSFWTKGVCQPSRSAPCIKQSPRILRNMGNSNLQQEEHISPHSFLHPECHFCYIFQEGEVEILADNAVLFLMGHDVHDSSPVANNFGCALPASVVVSQVSSLTHPTQIRIRMGCVGRHGLNRSL